MTRLLPLLVSLLVATVSAYFSPTSCCTGCSCRARRRMLHESNSTEYEIEAILRERFLLPSDIQPSELDPTLCCGGGNEFDFLLKDLDLTGAATADSPDSTFVWLKIPKGKTQQCVNACTNTPSTPSQRAACTKACYCRQDCNDPSKDVNDPILQVCKSQCPSSPASTRDACIATCRTKCVARCESGYNGYYIPYELYFQGVGILDCILGGQQSACNTAELQWETRPTAQFSCTATAGTQSGQVGSFSCTCAEPDGVCSMGNYMCDYSGGGVQCPSEAPSLFPTDVPSRSPSDVPSTKPSASPSAVPSVSPSHVPSTKPSASPSAVPSVSPSDKPSMSPSAVPSVKPSAVPSTPPSSTPSDKPSLSPSSLPSLSPSDVPSTKPSASPSDVPSSRPSMHPSSAPSFYSTVVSNGMPPPQIYGFSYLIEFNGCTNVVNYPISSGIVSTTYPKPAGCGVASGTFILECASGGTKNQNYITVSQSTTLFADGGSGKGTYYNLAANKRTAIDSTVGASLKGIFFYIKC